MTPPDPMVVPRVSGGVRRADRPSGTHRPVLVRTRVELDAALTERAGGSGEVTGGGRTYGRAVVMTMGALHDGHLSLVRRARELAEQVIVTIFVNPLQFGADEDLERYPRDLDGDLTRLAGVGADVVFAPTHDVMFPAGDPVVRVSAGRLGKVLEGIARPGHLDGVLTIVLKLMHLTRPDVSVFGQKDAQQVMAVQRMVRDLDVPVSILAVPTVRDADGLALSSRNGYLSPAERERALVLFRALSAGERVASEPGSGADAVRAAARTVLAGADVELDYLALIDPGTCGEVAGDHRGPAVLAVAARVGATHLIDNVPLWLGGRGGSGA